MCGLVGGGKTTLAKRLASELPALRLSRDEWMLRLYDLPFDDPRSVERLPACTDLLWSVALDTLALGTDVVLDWNHWSRQRRAEARERAAAAGYGLIIHFLDVPVAVAIERAAGRLAVGTAYAYEIDEAGVRHFATIFEPPDPSEGLEVHHHEADS